MTRERARDGEKPQKMLDADEETRLFCSILFFRCRSPTHVRSKRAKMGTKKGKKNLSIPSCVCMCAHIPNKAIHTSSIIDEEERETKKKKKLRRVRILSRASERPSGREGETLKDTRQLSHLVDKRPVDDALFVLFFVYRGSYSSLSSIF